MRRISTPFPDTNIQSIHTFQHRHKTHTVPMKRITRSASLPVMRTETEAFSQTKTQMIKTLSESHLNVYSDDYGSPDPSSDEKFEPDFSLRQSNILYIIFFIGAFLYLLADIYFIYIRWRSFNFRALPKKYISLLLINLLLWIDFNRNYKSNATTNVTNNLTAVEEIIQDSTHTLFCMILLPLIWIKDGIRSSFFYSIKHTHKLSKHRISKEK